MAKLSPDGAAAMRVVAAMEGNLTQAGELAYAIQMAVEGSTSVPNEEAGSLWRLARLIGDLVTAIEADRMEAFELLHGYAYPGGKAVQS